MSDGGKGSKPRPISVSNEEYAARWDAIFQRDRINEKHETYLKVLEIEKKRKEKKKKEKQKK